MYGHPANKMIVVGVTGTKGKSTTANLIWQVLTEGGNKVGLTSTMNFRIGEKEWMNDKKMTMLGRFKLQSLLKEMVKAGCGYAIIETSSEGIAQWRHLGINYDVAVFTNLSPEHIESHGSYENYRAAKGKLFEHLSKATKEIDGKKVEKIIVANKDDKEAEYFLNFPADKKIGFSHKEIKNEKADASGLEFDINNIHIKSGLIGDFNVENLLAAYTVGKALNIDEDVVVRGLEKVKNMPGRMEFIDEGQDFKVIVDYAYEPKSFENILKTIHELILQEGKLIVLTGSCGGGRDVSRRPKMGALAAKYADFIVVTNEDPYDDDPQKIINDVADGAIKADKKIDENIFKIAERGNGIKKALSLAGAGDVVLIAGKGCEPVMAVANGKYVPWDDREEARKVLRI